MHLVEAGEQEGARLRREPVPQRLADLLAQVAQRHHDLQPVAPGNALEHLDDSRTGVVADRSERAIVVVVRGRSGKHHSPADRCDQRSDRVHPGLVAGLADPRRRLPQYLAFAHREVVVYGIGEAQREQAVRERGAIDSRLPYLAPSTHESSFRRGKRGGVPDVTCLPFLRVIRPV
jgi:hypothetical protein